MIGPYQRVERDLKSWRKQSKVDDMLEDRARDMLTEHATEHASEILEDASSFSASKGIVQKGLSTYLKIK